MNTKAIKVFKKVIPISFIVLFTTCLTIPNTGLPREKENIAIVAKENRRITSFPQASTVSKKFYTEFEKWYQDRLRHRDNIIRFWNQTNFNLGVILKDHIVLGKNGWLFDKYRCLNSFKDANQKIALIKRIQTYCQNNNTFFLLLIPPSNETIYRDYLPQNIQKNFKDPNVWYKKAETMLKAYNINFMFLNKELNEYRSKNNYDLYFNDDHHWSYYGSLISSNLLLKKLSKEVKLNFYKNFNFDGTVKKAYKDSNYTRALGVKQNNTTFAPWNKNFTDEIYLTNSSTKKAVKVNKVLSWNTLQKPIIFGEAIITNKKINNNLKLLVLGESYSTYMTPYLSQNVSELILTHYRDCAGQKKNVDIPKLIKTYKPDAIVLTIYEDVFFRRPFKQNFSKIKY